MHNDDKDYLSIKSLVNRFWGRKYLILSITFLGAIFSVFFALSQNNIYRSTSVLKPVVTEGVQTTSGLGSIVATSASSILGELSATEAKVNFSLEKMQNLDFFMNLYRKENFLINLYAAESWDSEENILFLDPDIYNSENNEWTREVRGRVLKPTAQEAKKEFFESSFNVTYDKEKSFVHISVDHISPYVAQNWNEFIVERINQEIKQYDFDKTNQELQYLKNSLSLPEFSSIQDSIALLIISKINKLAEIESSPYYAFEYVQKAYVPERKHGPSRALICISITFFAFFFSLIISILFNIFGIKIRDLKFLNI